MIKLKDLITEGKKEYGFDLTDFKYNKFPVVLKNLGIKPKAKHMGRKGFYWKGSGILIVTGNNPITGEFNNPKSRKNETDYASYIGVEGDEKKVMKAVELIKKYARAIKGEDPKRRSYI